MLRFVKHYMTGIEGIAIYPIVSLLIFFIFFMVLFFWVITAKKEHIDHVSNLPFDSSTKNDNQTL
ncbi:MAG: CcoQ/FixQ family Cbb3-type cytochrome c oxidase assembly chaperone [Flavobacteriaceae bacterium]